MDFHNHRIAHRGVFNNTTIPENSLLAFQKALELKIGIELDVQLTKDDVIVVFHDDNLSRMTGINQEVSETKYEDIQKYSLLKTKETIPTISEVLKTVQEKVCIDIEVKTNKRYKTMIPLLMEELKNYHNFVLQSFDPRIVRFIKKNYPSLEVGYIMNRKKNLYSLFLNSKLVIRYSKADFLVIHKDLRETKKIQKYKQKMPILVWTMKKNDSIEDRDYIFICNDLMERKDICEKD